MNDKTTDFSPEDEKHMRQVMMYIYETLLGKGYNPINQIVGYILSGDPTFITAHNNARSMIQKLDRDFLLQSMVKNYLAK